MIGVIDVEIQAMNPNMPLHPWRAFAGSPSSARIRNVPRKIGDWQIDSVQLVAAYPDGEIKTTQCVHVGGVWVGTVPGCDMSGKGNYSVYASGTDENGQAVSDYCLGKGEVEILESDGSVTPGTTLAYVHLLSAQSETPHDGDLWQVSGTYYLYQDGQAWPIGDDSGLIAELSARIETKQDALNDNQVFAIDSAQNAFKTKVKYTYSPMTWDYYLSGLVTSADFLDIGNVTNVRLGEGVTGLDKKAFYGCSALTSITFPEGFTMLCGNVFEGAGLTSVKLPNSLSVVGGYSFSKNKLSSIDIPASVKTIREGAFNRCSSLVDVKLHEGLNLMSSYVFRNCTNLGKIEISRSVETIGYGIFLDCPNISSVIFRDRTLEEVQAMENYPWGIGNYRLSVFGTAHEATQEWVSDYAVKNDGGVSKIKSLTESQYAAISASADLSTLYVITED